MGKYLELFRGEVGDLTEKTKLENKPYVAYSTKLGKVTYTVVPVKDPIVEGPADNEIWYTTVDDQPLYLWYTDPAHSVYNTFKSEDFFKTKVVSNIYTDKGIIEFQDPVRIVKYHGIADVYPFLDPVSGSSTLKTIVLPNSVTSIGDYAFYGCSSLTSITFEGTMEEWNSVTKGSYWNSDAPITHVQCTDGQVAL